MTDAEMHNLYPLLYARQMWEGFAQYANRRPVVFTVSGWSGFQAWCGTWTGDTGGRLETLGAMLNTAMLGHCWATNDMEVMQPEGIHFGYLQPWSQINSFRFFNAETVSLSSNCFLGFDDLYFWDGLASGYEYSFQTGSGLDNPYVISSTGKINTGDFYYNDLNMETVLKFHLEDATNVERVELTMKTGGQLALYVSGDGENWDTVFKCFIPSEVKSFGGLAVMTRYYDLTEYVDLDSSQDVYVKIGDAFTEDGFGGRLYDVSLQIGQKHN